MSNVLRDTKIREYIRQLEGNFGLLNEEVVSGGMSRAACEIGLLAEANE